MERAHRQLRARLTNRLCRDNADSLTDVDSVTAREVATVALRTHAVADFAGNRRTHLDVVDRQILETLYRGFVEQRLRPVEFGGDMGTRAITNELANLL